MTFQSILFARAGDGDTQEVTEAPAFFRDLNLDQIVDSITAEWKEYNLAPFFYARLNDLDGIRYRQEVMRDLEDRVLVEEINAFAKQMRVMRQRLDQAKNLDYYKYASEKCFLGAAAIYAGAVERLSRALCAIHVNSRGLQGFREYLTAYLASTLFRNLSLQTAKLTADLAVIQYNIFLRKDGITVRHHDGETDYSQSIAQRFEKFTREASKDYWVEVYKSTGMNHIEERVLVRVAALHPETFQALDLFCAAYSSFIDETIVRFDREIQFYVAYLSHAAKFRRIGLSFSIPQLSQTSKAEGVRETFDLALAEKLLGQKSAVVLNDFYLADQERIFVVSGPNHGGKTTFARLFGQLHYLTSLGCPVPGREARLFLCDQLFTHFEREEDMTNLRGKLQDDLVRIHEILTQATPNTILVMNEVFSSTTVSDAALLSQRVMTKMSDLDLLAVWVTFLDELASFNRKTVSVVAGTAPGDPNNRTFKLERRPADGLAYALTIAQKHRVTYECLRERIKP
ncbi:MAG TPA: hypothetical protein VMB66_15155 [Candidatus Acidoferrales bacterium]|nr:hypothetical protein [Candidatus Acidoferrales bacterium]